MSRRPSLPCLLLLLVPAIARAEKKPVYAITRTKADSEKSSDDHVLFVETGCAVFDTGGARECVNGNDPDLITASIDIYAEDRKTALSVDDKNLRAGPGKDWPPKLRDLVATAEPFDAPTLKVRVEEFSQAAGAKPKDVSQALRVAVTGKAVGFDAYGTLVILGRASCLARIERAIGRLS